LDGYRVLELPGAEIALCGKMYADLGGRRVRPLPCVFRMA